MNRLARYIHIANFALVIFKMKVENWMAWLHLELRKRGCTIIPGSDRLINVLVSFKVYTSLGNRLITEDSKMAVVHSCDRLKISFSRQNVSGKRLQLGRLGLDFEDIPSTPHTRR